MLQLRIDNSCPLRSDERFTEVEIEEGREFAPVLQGCQGVIGCENLADYFS